MDNTFQKIPFLRITLALILGILLGKYFSIPPTLILICAFLNIGALILLHRNYKYSYESAFGISTFSLFILLGTYVYTQKNKTPHYYEEGIYLATILEKPQEKQNSYKGTLQITAVANSDTVIKTKEKVQVFFEKSDMVKNLMPGNTITFKTTPGQVENFGTPYGFDYKSYLNNIGIYRQVYLNRSNWRLTQKQKRTARINAELIREKLRNIYQRQNLGDNETEILSALTLGYKRDLDPETRRVFSAAGAMHILAVSGLHVGIIYMVFASAFSFLRKQKYGRILFVISSISLLWIYAFITGLSPSVLRAATMFSIVILGDNLKRKSNIYNSLAASAMFLLLINPNHLFNIGFQLSYSAVFGIVFLQPRIAGLYTIKNKILKFFWELIAVSLAAQLATFPLTAFYFNQFPSYFLLSNCIVIPAVMLLIPLGLSLLMVAKIPIIGKAVAFLVQWLIKMVYLILSRIEQLPHSTFDLSFKANELIFLLLFLLFLFAFIQNNKASPLKYSLLAFLMLVLTVFANNIKRDNSNEIIVFNQLSNPTILLIQGPKNYVISQEEITADDFSSRQITEIRRKKRLEKPIFLCFENDFEDKFLYLKNGFIAFNNKTIYFEREPVTASLDFNFDYYLTNRSFKNKLPGKNGKTTYISSAYISPTESDQHIYSLKTSGAFVEKWE